MYFIFNLGRCFYSSFFLNIIKINYIETSYKAQKLWPKFVDELNELNELNEVEINENGTYIMLNSKGTSIDDTPKNQSISDALERVNEPYFRVTGTDIPGHYPARRNITCI